VKTVKPQAGERVADQHRHPGAGDGANGVGILFQPCAKALVGLSVVCEDSETAGRVLGQLKATVRRNYSSPPSFGAHIAARGNLLQRVDQRLTHSQDMRAHGVHFRLPGGFQPGRSVKTVKPQAACLAN
jgi:hypothetical protein